MSAIDNAIDWLTKQVQTAGNAIESITDEWSRKVNELKAKAYEFTQLYNKVKTKIDKLPADSPVRKEAQETLSNADKVKVAVESITRKIDTVAGSMSYFTGAPVKMDGIFLAPVPLAIIAGAITILSTQLISLRKLDEKLDHQQYLIEQGADPNKVVEAGANKPFFDFGSISPLLLIAIIGAGYIAWPNIKQKFKL